MSSFTWSQTTEFKLKLQPQKMSKSITYDEIVTDELNPVVDPMFNTSTAPFPGIWLGGYYKTASGGWVWESNNEFIANVYENFRSTIDPGSAPPLKAHI